MRRAATTRPRTCCTRRFARCSARTSSRPARSWRPTGCGSTSSIFRPVTDDELDRIERSSTSRSCGTRPSTPRCVRPTKRSPPARWRSSARSTATRSAWSACRLQPRAVRRHPRARHGRHRVVRASRTRAAWPRASAGSKRSPGLARSSGLRERRSALARVLSALHVHEDQAVEAIEKLHGEVKRLTRELSQLKTRAAMGGGATPGGDVGRGRRREAGLPQGRRAGQGRPARSGRFAQGTDSERRRRDRIVERGQGPDSWSRSRRTWWVASRPARS